MIKIITVSANTLDEAKKKLLSQITENAFLISVSESNPETQKVKFADISVENAFKLAAKEIPKELRFVDKQILRDPFIKHYEIFAYTDNESRSGTLLEIKGETEVEITSIVLKKKGKRSIFGFRRNPNTYLAEVLYKAIVEINYGTYAQIIAEITDSISEAEFAFVKHAESGNLELVKSFLQKGININSRNTEGATALMLATFKGHHELAFYLLQNNIDVTITDKGGFNALMLACESSFPSKELVQQIIESGCNVNANSKRGSTALMAAAKSGHLELVKLLVSKSADINATNTDHNITPLIWAANCGHIEIVKFLLLNGAKKNILTHNNYTAATIAKENSHYDIVNLLLQ